MNNIITVNIKGLAQGLSLITSVDNYIYDLKLIWTFNSNSLRESSIDAAGDRSGAEPLVGRGSPGSLIYSSGRGAS